MPIKQILKLVFNSIIGGILILIINWIGAMFNFHIGLNIFTAIFVGIYYFIKILFSNKKKDFQDENPYNLTEN